MPIIEEKKTPEDDKEKQEADKLQAQEKALLVSTGKTKAERDIDEKVYLRKKEMELVALEAGFQTLDDYKKAITQLATDRQTAQASINAYCKNLEKKVEELKEKEEELIEREKDLNTNKKELEQIQASLITSQNLLKQREDKLKIQAADIRKETDKNMSIIAEANLENVNKQKENLIALETFKNYVYTFNHNVVYPIVIDLRKKSFERTANKVEKYVRDYFDFIGILPTRPEVEIEKKEGE